MPRIDAGWIAVDLPAVQEMGYAKARELAFESEAYLVTAPSIVTVRTGLNTLAITLSVGSLLVPPGSSTRGPVLTRAEWVDACKVTPRGGRPLNLERKGDPRVVEGTLVAYDYSDPVALALNGIKGVHVVTGRVEECTPLVYLGDHPVVGVKGYSYCTSLAGGDAFQLLEYITVLYTSCLGR